MIWILDVFASLFSWPKGLFKYKATLNIVLVHINTFGIAIGILCVPSSIIAVHPRLDLVNELVRPLLFTKLSHSLN